MRTTFTKCRPVKHERSTQERWLSCLGKMKQRLTSMKTCGLPSTEDRVDAKGCGIHDNQLILRMTQQKKSSGVACRAFCFELQESARAPQGLLRSSSTSQVSAAPPEEGCVGQWHCPKCLFRPNEKDGAVVEQSWAWSGVKSVLGKSRCVQIKELCGKQQENCKLRALIAMKDC